MAQISHELYVGNCLQIMRSWTSDRFDLVCADPPYCSATAAGFKAPTSQKYCSTDAKRRLPDFGGDNRDQRAFQLWTSFWAAEAFRLTRAGGAMLVFIDFRNLAAMIDAIQVAGWTYSGVLPWIKKTGRPRRSWFRTSAVEYVVLCSKGKQTEDVYGPHFIQHQPPSGNKRVHQTQKPVDLLVELIQWRPDWVRILDPFAGSGTVFEAAEKMGRLAVGIEMSPEYAATAKTRSQSIKIRTKAK